jgi:hypothetical protein
VTDAPPPLPTHPEATYHSGSLAYVGDIDETPDLVKTIERPNDDTSVVLGTSNHVLLDLNDPRISDGCAISEEPEDSVGPNIRTEILPDSAWNVQQSVLGLSHTEERTEMEKNALPIAIKYSDDIKKSGTVDNSFLKDVSICEVPTDYVRDKTADFIPDESCSNTNPVETSNNDDVFERRQLDLMNQPILENKDSDVRNTDKPLGHGHGGREDDTEKEISAKKIVVLDANEKSEGQIISNWFASDSNPIASSKKTSNNSNTKHGLNDRKATKASTNANVKTDEKFTAESSPLHSESHRESKLPRVATLYKTMKPTVEKSRMASRGEIPFIFRNNGSHVYITNYKDDNECKRSSKSNVAAVPPRISHLAAPKHRGSPSVTSEARVEMHRKRTNSSNDQKPKPDIDDFTLDELLEAGQIDISDLDATPKDTAAKVEPESSPIDVRQIDSVAGSHDPMTPKNLDNTAF